MSEIVDGVQIRVRGLVKQFGEVEALRGLDLETSGQWGCLGILGRNGAGKTTLLRILAGLTAPSSGEISLQINGQSYSHADPSKAVYIGEHQTLVDSITGWQYLSLHEAMNRLLGVTVDHALREKLIDDFALAEHLPKPPEKMSKGTRRKLELVAAVSSNTPLLIADELAEGVDVPSMYAFERLIMEQSKQGKRFVVSSHNVSFLSDACDTLAVIDQGKCVDFFRLTDDTPVVKQRILDAFDCLDEAGEAAP